jgi:hypothetical protein
LIAQEGKKMFQKGMPIADVLPADTEMVGTAMPLNTKENNDHIKEFLKGKEYLKKELLKALT